MVVNTSIAQCSMLEVLTHDDLFSVFIKTMHAYIYMPTLPRSKVGKNLGFR
jgi:hypothetical protein